LSNDDGDDDDEINDEEDRKVIDVDCSDDG
jgi:hypothetical protein